MTTTEKPMLSNERIPVRLSVIDAVQNLPQVPAFWPDTEEGGDDGTKGRFTW